MSSKSAAESFDPRSVLFSPSHSPTISTTPNGAGCHAFDGVLGAANGKHVDTQSLWGYKDQGLFIG